MEWQPIETAPKDGTRILVNFHGRVKEVFWDDPYGENMTFAIWCVDDDKHGPYPLRGYSEGDDTHWMPLPEPPST